MSKNKLDWVISSKAPKEKSMVNVQRLSFRACL